MTETLRLFLAYWPEPPIRRLMAHAAHEAAQNDGRPVQAHNLHMTLLFFGSVEEEKLDQLVDAIERLEPEPVHLLLDRLSWQRRAQMIWLGSSKPSPQLNDMVEQQRAVARAFGIEVDTRPYSPHVTLARKVRRSPSLPLIKPIDWHVCDWTLVRSETRNEGAIYTPIWDTKGGYIA